jgi:hypothetical protein
LNVLLQRVEESWVENKAFQLVSIEPSLVDAGGNVKKRW